MRLSRTAVAALSAASTLLAVAIPSVAFAQDPLPKPPKPVVAAPPPDPGYGPDYDAPPAPVTIAPNCTLGEHAGVAEPEARTAAEIVCYELSERHAATRPHRVRFGVLAGRTLFVLETRGDDGSVLEERRTFLAGMDEISVAAPRVVEALVGGTPVAETRNVDNVLAGETSTAKVRRGQMGFDGGIFGTTSLGVSGGSSAGIALGLLYRAESVGLGAQARFGGIGSSATKTSLTSLDFGARYYLSTSDITPYVGGGFAISSVHVERESGPELDGSGFGAYVAVGAELLRTHHAAVSASLRVDLPFYALEGSTYDSSTTGELRRSQYVAPLSFNVNFIFR